MIDIDSILDLTAVHIARITAESYRELVERIGAGESPQDILADIQARWAGRFEDKLTESFTALLGRAVGTAEVRTMPIGEVVLSDRLYRHGKETTAIVRQIIKDHAAGMHSARDLALKIYEGYNFKEGGDPLKVRAKLPKYLRAALRESTYEAGLSRLLEQGRVMNIKTPALRAAYLQSLKALEDGAGKDRLAKLVRTAWYERNRYFANRIAQTELARAHIDQRAAEIMVDDQISVVRWSMSGTHPKTDICDLHANVDKFGLGPGCYPKAKAPKPPAHPHCRCKLSPVITKDAAGARENPAAERVWLRQMMKEQGVSEAAKVMGSRAKLAAALTNAPIDEIINIKRPKPYWLQSVSETPRRMAVMEPFMGQRPGLRNLQPIEVTELTGDEFGIGLSHRQLTAAANEKLRGIQRGDGLLNDDTDWTLRVNKSGRKKMGDNEAQSDSELRAVSGIESLVKRAVVGERHADEEHHNEFVHAVVRMYAPVSIGGTLYRAKLTVKDYGDPKQLHALSAVEIEDAPLGTLPTSSAFASVQSGQPTTGRNVTIAELLKDATRNDGKKFKF